MAKDQGDSTPRDPLTGKQRLFVEAYLGMARCNASEAARIAGYATPGDGADYLKIPKIRDEISKRTSEVAMTADEVLRGLADIARGDISDFLDVQGTDGRGALLNLTKAEENGKMHLVKKCKAVALGTEIELYDKQAALVQLGKHHGLWGDRLDGQKVDLNAVITRVEREIVHG